MPSSLIEAVSNSLILEQDFVPLEKLLPESGFAAASFQACLARLRRRDAVVLAFLHHKQEDAADLAQRAGVLLAALQRSEPFFSGRIVATLMLVSEEPLGGDFWKGVLAIPEGHFLAKTVLRKACLVKGGPGRKVRVLASAPGDLFPKAEWFLEKASERRVPTAREVEEVLSQRSQDEQKARLWFSPRHATWGTYALIGLNVAYYLSYRLFSQGGSEPDYMAVGANNRLLVLQHGEWWRLFTCQFVHFGELHLIMNMVSLFSIGTFLERLAGTKRFLAIYFLSGLAGSLLGLFNPPLVKAAGQVALVPSGGASGAVLGLVGALLALHWRRPAGFPRMLAERLYGALVKPTLFIFGLGGAIWLLSRLGVVPFQIDNWAHLGGLACGFVSSFFFPFHKPSSLDTRG